MTAARVLHHSTWLRGKRAAAGASPKHTHARWPLLHPCLRSLSLTLSLFSLSLFSRSLFSLSLSLLSRARAFLSPHSLPPPSLPPSSPLSSLSLKPYLAAWARGSSTAAPAQDGARTRAARAGAGADARKSAKGRRQQPALTRRTTAVRYAEPWAWFRV